MSARALSVELSGLPLVDLLSQVADGECRYDPDLHTGPDAFTAETLAERQARIDAARDICETCPVRDACLEYALRVTPTHGVWAGHTPKEIAGLRSAARSTRKAA
ncbi:WhiB family transcriptional regulator [Actinocorallia longicatena]|uniref:4Fe-4S Wbl-type domain-containing protein n=1 Tax=Actinocorallia longicatena TaxID=111803 RepID=A0ABP6QIY8_9ACTN